VTEKENSAVIFEDVPFIVECFKKCHEIKLWRLYSVLYSVLYVEGNLQDSFQQKSSAFIRLGCLFYGTIFKY
jgi:hypothetical protein